MRDHLVFPWRRWAVAALASCVLVTACGGDEGNDAAGTGFASLLARYPAELFDEFDGVWYVDFALLSEQLGADPEDFDEYAKRMFLDHYTLPGTLFQRDAFQVEEWRAEIGFDVTGVRQELSSAARPVALIAAVEPSAATIEGALRSDPFWGERTEEAEHAGVTYLDWDGGADESPTEIEGVGVLRPVGQGGQVLLTDALFIRTIGNRYLRSLIDVAEGASAGEDPVVAEMIDALDGAVVAQALLQPAVGEATFDGRMVAELVRDGELVPVLLLHYGDGAAATAAAAALEEGLASGTSAVANVAWSELLGTVEVRVEGNTVVATPSAEDAFGRLIQAVAAEEPVLSG